MNNNHPQIINKILSEYINLEKNYNSSFIKLVEQISNDFLPLKSKNNDLVQIKSIIENLEDVFHAVREKNRLTSSDFNVLKLFRIKEPQHSYLLYNFLYPYGTHGQGHLFLNQFLDSLGIERKSDKELWTVTAEKGRIDLLLKRRNPHSIIVIENKSNKAEDQKNQMYRYWYKEIYLPIKRKYGFYNKEQDPSNKHYQLLYLTPSSMKKPTKNSLTKPADWIWDSNLPETVPMKITYVAFDKFIVQWLEKSVLSIPQNNHRIKEYVKQYIEYWQY